MVEELIELVASHREDGRLKWYNDGSVRIIVGSVLPEGSAVKQTLEDRPREISERT